MKNIFNNEFLYLADSYKYSHHKQYPEDLTKLYSYFESRGFKTPFVNGTEVVFYGLRYLLSKIEGSLFTVDDVERAREYYKEHFIGKDIFNYDGFKYIAEQHDGRLPIRIKAIPEGTVIKPSNILMSVESLDKKVPWITNYIETYLTRVWYPTTVATLSREIKKMMYRYLLETDGKEVADKVIPFMLQDFGMRGVTCDEAAALGGSGQLINFMGTDTTSALRFVDQVYNNRGMAGFSVPATEHSVMTIKGRDGELEQLKRAINAYPSSAIVSIVIDSYDTMNLIDNWICGELKETIMSRKGKVVLRPDSGDPEQVIMQILRSLEKGYSDEITTNENGYSCLPPQLGLLWGDGIDYMGIHDVLYDMKTHGWAVSNIIFGMGGGLLQKVNRDSLKFAFKASYAEFADGSPINVYKDPITQPDKRSKKGRLALIKDDGEFKTLEETIDHKNDLLEIVFESGNVYGQQTNDFKYIRTRAKI